MIETESEAAADAVKESFPNSRRTGACQIHLCGRDHAIGDVLRFIADNNVVLVRLERVEPTLESLFMEVAGK